MADQHDRHVAQLGDAHELLGASAHLRDRARRRADRRVVHGLDRVDHDDVGLHVVDRGDDVGERGLGEQPERIAHCIEPLGAEPDLLCALLGGHVQRLALPSRHQLQEDRALADARLTTEQRDRTGYEAAAEDPIELTDARADRPTDQRVDLADLPWYGRGGRYHRRVARDRHLFDQGVPLPARRALPGPLGVRGTAVGAHVFDLRLGHATSVTDGCHRRVRAPGRASCDPSDFGVERRLLQSGHDHARSASGGLRCRDPDPAVALARRRRDGARGRSDRRRGADGTGRAGAAHGPRPDDTETATKLESAASVRRAVAGPVRRWPARARCLRGPSDRSRSVIWPIRNIDARSGVPWAMATATFNGTVIARSDATVLVEGNHYFPPSSVVAGVLEPTDRTTHCPWKGDAGYYDVVVDGERARRTRPGTTRRRRMPLPRSRATSRSTRSSPSPTDARTPARRSAPPEAGPFGVGMVIRHGYSIPALRRIRPQAAAVLRTARDGDRSRPSVHRRDEHLDG